MAAKPEVEDEQVVHAEQWQGGGDDVELPTSFGLGEGPHSEEEEEQDVLDVQVMPGKSRPAHVCQLSTKDELASRMPKAVHLVCCGSNSWICMLPWTQLTYTGVVQQTNHCCKIARMVTNLALPPSTVKTSDKTPTYSGMQRHM